MHFVYVNLNILNINSKRRDTLEVLSFNLLMVISHPPILNGFTKTIILLLNTKGKKKNHSRNMILLLGICTTTFHAPPLFPR